MIEPIVLLEHESRRVALPDATARRLVVIAAKKIKVRPEGGAGHWRLKAGSYVGSVTVDDVRILVRTKVRAENLFFFLEAGLPDTAWRAEAFEYHTDHDLLPAVLSFFARTLEQTLATGLLRSYRRRHERLVALRGRIDLPSQLSRAGPASPVDCRFDEYTADTEENRYLRAAVRLALRAPRVPAGDRRRLLQALAALADVADVDVRPEALDRIAYTRLNAHYWPALRLARLLLADLTLVDVLGNCAASAFLVDMNKLFERFLTLRLTELLRGRLRVQSQGSWNLDHGRSIELRPDLVFHRRDAPMIVADIKYKLADNARAKREDYYQLLAYTTALGLSDGLLIYCRTQDGIPASAARVIQSGTVLHIRAIDATRPPHSVAAELAELADWIADHALLT